MKKVSLIDIDIIQFSLKTEREKQENILESYRLNRQPQY